MKPNTILLILSLCAALLVPGLAGAQGKTPLDMCLDGKLERASRVKACKTAAKQGHAKAQTNLGLMYDFGKGVPQDYTEAARWYRQAADQGFAGAQYNLGLRYDNGQGVPKDYTEAVRWYRLAAEQRYATAQGHLGLRYAEGKGVPQDYAKAVRWYRLAAEQRYATAQAALGVMYATKAKGCPRIMLSPTCGST